KYRNQASRKKRSRKTTCKMSVYEEREQETPVGVQRAAISEFSCVAMKSNNSMNKPSYLSDGAAVTFDPV
ncbi:hypothetical protein M9458_053683, partial [Cirrhinus mrigala]